jgi:hypothetical protein
MIMSGVLLLLRKGFYPLAALSSSNNRVPSTQQKALLTLHKTFMSEITFLFHGKKYFFAGGLF